MFTPPLFDQRGNSIGTVLSLTFSDVLPLGVVQGTVQHACDQYRNFVLLHLLQLLQQACWYDLHQGRIKSGPVGCGNLPPRILSLAGLSLSRNIV